MITDEMIEASAAKLRPMFSEEMSRGIAREILTAALSSVPSAGAGVVDMDELIATAAEWGQWAFMWSGSEFIANEKHLDPSEEADHKAGLYSDLCKLGNNMGWLEDKIATLRPSASEAQVRRTVKLLEWKQGDEDAAYHFAQSSIENYIITEFADDGPRFRLLGTSQYGVWFYNLGDAKAAAQADYERRILSALSTPEQVETPAPVTHLRGIETAPKDGTWFIAYQNGEPFPCDWRAEEQDEGPPREGWFDFFNRSFEDPTHWVPVMGATTEANNG